MAYYTQTDLDLMAFKSIGSNVKISTKASIYNHDEIEIGDNSRIDDFCVISGKVIIGKHVQISVFCNLAGGEEGIFFDDFTTLAYGCNLFSQSDDYSGESLTNPTVPDQFKLEIKLPIYIKKHTIVGASSVIMPGVTLAEGTSVGAMSLVNKDTLPWSIYCGIPAKKIRERKQDLLKLEQILLAEEAKQ